MQEILSKEKVGLRIRELRRQNTYSQETVATSLGLSRSNYSQIELGNQYPSYEILVKIAIYYSKSYDWILHGGGFADTLNEKIKIKRFSKDFSVPNPVISTHSNEITLVRNSDCYEYLSSNKDEKYIGGLATIKIPLPKSETQELGIHRAFEVADEGMTSVLHKEDIIICQNITDLSQIIFNDIYVIITSDEIIIRRIAKCIEDNKLLLCKADNYNYPVLVIKINEIQEVWHVGGIFSTKFTSIVENMGQHLERFEKSISKLSKEVEKIKKKSPLQ